MRFRTVTGASVGHGPEGHRAHVPSAPSLLLLQPLVRLRHVLLRQRRSLLEGVRCVTTAHTRVAAPDRSTEHRWSKGQTGAYTRAE